MSYRITRVELKILIGFNKINHILQEKHLWSRLVNNADDWSSVSKIMERVLKEGVEQPYGSVFIKTLIIDGQTVQVIYQKINGVIRVSDGWIKP